MSDGKTYQMLWDCQFCGTNGNLGLTHRFCPSCGAPQNPDSRYYPSDEDKIEVENHQFVGVDVTCPACGELNGAASEFCGQCGSPLTEGVKARTLEAQSMGVGNSFASSGSRDVIKEKFDAEMQRVGILPSSEKPKRGGFSPMVMGILAIVVVLIGAAIYLFTAKVESTLVVTGHEWERSIDIQEYQNFTDRSWRDSRPAGDNVSMRSGSCRQEQRSTRRVADGQECRTVRSDQGDGTFRERQECETRYREEPVYDDMCTWEGQRWTNVQAASASTALGAAPFWPEANLNCENQSRVGCQRESGRNEDYRVLYRDDEGKEYRCEFTEQEWDAIELESVWTAQVGRFVTNLDCDSLQPR
jgi:hypothetical protein